jgi:nitrite reductase/ring-hydroxylating ferredoxin subunit
MKLDSMRTVKWRRLIREADLVPGKVQVRKALWHLVGVVKVNGRVYVFDGSCPHAGRSLQGSEVTSRGIMECPGHGLRLSLGSQPCSVDAIPLTQLAFRVRNGVVEINRSALRRKP